MKIIYLLCAITIIGLACSKNKRSPEEEARIDKLARARADSLIKTAINNAHRDIEGFNEVVRWIGYQDNNIIVTINTDKEKDSDALMRYARFAQKQTKKYQNVYLYFYSHNAPKRIKAPEGTEGGLDPALTFIKSTKPYYTIKIIGDAEFYPDFGYSD